MTVRLLRGDMRVTLPTLEAGSVQACVTSPPYYGLRSYGTPDLVWGGDPDHEHEWARAPRGIGHVKGNKTPSVASTLTNGDYQFGARSNPGSPTQLCPCGAWLGSLGLEPTPDLFLEHLVECFRHVARVLHDDGVLWCNMGDSYAGSGNGAHDYRDRATSASLSLNPDKYKGQKPLQRVGPQEHTEGHGRVQGYKAKDLMMMPSRLAIALQADGWYLRSMIPWLKRAAMPESVTDRPSSAVEYIFLFSKSPRYFFDADAVRVPWADNRLGNPGEYKPDYLVGAGRHDVATKSKAWDKGTTLSGRNRRNTDWFFESWQGLMLGEDDAPLAMIVNPSGFSGAHFATFPPKLVEPMVKASSRPGDTILDPFAGASTTLLVADRLGRNAVGCELSDSYADLGSDRVVGDAPMFVELEQSA